MGFIGGDEDDVAGLEGAAAFGTAGHAAAFQDEDFVFVRVLVVRGATAGFDFEMAHVEERGPVFGADEDAHAGAFRAGGGDQLLTMGLDGSDFHAGEYTRGAARP